LNFSLRFIRHNIREQRSDVMARYFLVLIDCSGVGVGACVGIGIKGGIGRVERRERKSKRKGRRRTVRKKAT
jgi:hypothetical protein